MIKRKIVYHYGTDKVSFVSMKDNWKIAGETKVYDYKGNLIYHTYEVNSIFYDLQENPILDPVEKMLITLKYGGKWLPDE